MSECLRAALWYSEHGYSVIPAGPDKKPLTKWEEYQKRRATPDEIRAWWKQWPQAMVGIVTGEISNLFVVDADSEKGIELLEQYIPDSIETPIVKTPKGRHYWFRHQEGLHNTARFVPECDTRGEGGYIIAPPSKSNGDKKYSWQIKVSDIIPTDIPSSLLTILKTNTNKYSIPYLENATTSNKAQQGATPLSFSEGSRAEDLFHVSYSLFKGGMAYPRVTQCVELLAGLCVPPYPSTEAKERVDSAFKRAMGKDRNLTDEIREWVSATFGPFSTTMLYQEQQIATKDDRHKVRTILSRLVADKLIERIPNRNGWYRKPDETVVEMNYLEASGECVNIRLPFGMESMIEIMPGNIILIAGEPNSGKTAWLLNIIRDNMNSHHIWYFNSEMGEGELRKRLEKFEDVRLEAWRFKAFERSSDFGDVLRPGKGNINIIDFLEIHDNFYEIGGKIADIHRRLNGAIAIIAIQKKPGKDQKIGIGGFLTLEKPRLVLSMRPHQIEIVKAKNWRTTDNPNGLVKQFALVQGCKFIAKSAWEKGA